MRKHANKITAGVIIVIMLAVVYWWGGGAPSLRGWGPDRAKLSTVTQETEKPEQSLEKQEKYAATEEDKPVSKDHAPMTADEKMKLAEQMAKERPMPTPSGSTDDAGQSDIKIREASETDANKSEPVPEGKPLPVAPQDVTITDRALTCTLSVRCDTILKNIAWLNQDKVELVPRDGIVFAEKPVTFYEGESVFNVLVREMKKHKIHLEFMNTPIYNSAYIEGIANIYEFDCGELSGWKYKVNGWFPNYGCSRYQLKDGDRVEWVYTCDLGLDIGGSSAVWQKDA